MALQPEQCLDANLDARGIVANVVDLVTSPCRRGKSAWRQPVEPLARVPIDLAEHGVDQLALRQRQITPALK